MITNPFYPKNKAEGGGQTKYKKQRVLGKPKCIVLEPRQAWECEHLEMNCVNSPFFP